MIQDGWLPNRIILNDGEDSQLGNEKGLPKDNELKVSKDALVLIEG